LNKSLEDSFDQYSNGTTNDVQTPICDADKLVLKQNMRKLDIYDKAYRFCDELFEMDLANETASDGSCRSNVNSNLTEDQLL
jgi:hypothetical protein